MPYSVFLVKMYNTKYMYVYAIATLLITSVQFNVNQCCSVIKCFYDANVFFFWFFFYAVLCWTALYWEVFLILCHPHIQDRKIENISLQNFIKTFHY